MCRSACRSVAPECCDPAPASCHALQRRVSAVRAVCSNPALYGSVRGRGLTRVPTATVEWRAGDCSLYLDFPMTGRVVSDGLIFRMAKRLEIAIDTSWAASYAYAAAMPDQLVRELDPPVLRQNLHQVLLDLFGFGVLCEFQPPRESQNMGIDHNAARNSVSRAQNHVGGFSRDA